MYVCRYDPRGRETSRRLYDTDGHPRRNSQGIAGWDTEFDRFDREVKHVFVDEDGNPALSKRVVSYATEYDEAGDVAVQVSFDRAGKEVHRERRSATAPARANAKALRKPSPPSGQANATRKPAPSAKQTKNATVSTCDQLVSFAQACFEQSILDITCTQLYAKAATSMGTGPGEVCKAICDQQRKGVQWPVLRARVRSSCP